MRLKQPGAVYHGTCLGYLADPKGQEGTNGIDGGTVAPGCSKLRARTHYTQVVTPPNAFKGSLILIPQATMTAGTHHLNITFAQDITSFSSPMQAGLRANNLFASITYASEPYFEFELEFTSAFPEEQLCVTDVNCDYLTADDLTKERSIHDNPDPLDLSIQQYYDAVAEYECGYGRGFAISDWPAAVELPKELAMRCSEDGRWLFEPFAETTALVGTEWDGSNMPLCRCK